MDEEIILLDVSYFSELKELIDSCSEWRLNQKINEGSNSWKEYYSEEVIFAKLVETTVYGLFQDEELVGAVSLSNSPPSYYQEEDFKFYKIQDENPTYLGMLAVNPKSHKQGLATKIIKFCEEISKVESKSIRIDVLKNYESLNEFYKKRGFMLVKEISDKDEDMNYYEKEL